MKNCIGSKIEIWIKGLGHVFFCGNGVIGVSSWFWAERDLFLAYRFIVIFMGL